MATLFVAATPIGNLKDASDRLKETLTNCALIAAEDTRVTRRLLSAFGISTRLISCHEHNEATRSERIIERMLKENIDVAYVTDAGTPGISDPGQTLVDAVWASGLRVTAIPGPSACATVLSVCGFYAREYAFYGFLPREKAELRRKLLAMHATQIPIAVVYESPHRVIALLERICETLPETRVCCACDLTKFYELIYRGRADAVLSELRANSKVEKGEYCLALDFSRQPLIEMPRITESVALIMRVMEGVKSSDAVRQLTKEGYAKNALYRARLNLTEFAKGYIEGSESDV